MHKKAKKFKKKEVESSSSEHESDEEFEDSDDEVSFQNISRDGIILTLNKIIIPASTRSGHGKAETRSEY
jgi:hypothetical protein